MSFDIWHSLVIFVVLFVNGRITIWIYHWNNQRNEKKFIKSVQIKYPNAKVSMTSISGRDDVALRKLKKQLEEQ